MTETPDQIETERVEAAAADWLVRLQSDALADEGLLEFEQWLIKPAHREAFDRVEALWLDLDDVAAISRSETVVSFKAAKPSHPTRRIGWPIAAGLAIAASLAGFAIMLSRNVPVTTPVVFEAAKGANRIIALRDGSHIHLGGGSRLMVQMGKAERRVQLDGADGEAAFDVAKDSSRPFIILAGDRSIRVVGTEFDVRRAAGRLLVTVRRGVVEVAALDPGAKPVRLTPGQEYSHRQGEAEARVAAVDPEVAFGWTTGDRTYRDQPLEEVVADLNRYLDTPLQVDPTAAGLRFTGILRIDEEDAVVRRLQAFLPITASRTGQAVVLQRAPG